MLLIVGLIVVFGSIVVGYTMHGGRIAALVQISEFIIIGGAGLGSVLVANPPSVVAKTFREIFGLVRGNPYTKARYMELLQMLYDMFMMARREGVVALDQHVERPEESSFFRRYPFFHSNHHALSFLADTMKVMISGSVATYDLMELMDVDLETMREEAMRPSHIMAKVADAMPGFGIVAAVLGVVITMGAIGGPPEEVGHKVAAALVGTFLGILLSYGIFGPIAAAMEAQVNSEGQYLSCIKYALLSFGRGDAPLTGVEFARRNIEPSVRPSFTEMEETLKSGARTTARAA